MGNDTDDKKYTLEQKLVSAVWVHEKAFNNQTWADISHNFRVRFSIPSPKKNTFMSWERRLFTTGDLNDSVRLGRPCARLMHVPYVKASLEEAPSLSLRERAQSLGLPRSTLLKILKDDLNMTFEVGNNSDDDDDVDKPDIKKIRRLCYNVGKWKKNGSTVTDVKTKIEQNDNNENTN